MYWWQLSADEALSSSRKGGWKTRKGGEDEIDSEGLGGINDPDYTHSISLSERESFGPDGAIQLLLARGEDSAEKQPRHQEISLKNIQHINNNMQPTYREAVETQMWDMNTDGHKPKGLRSSFSSEWRWAVMTVAGHTAQCQDAFSLTVRSCNVHRSTLFPILDGSDVANHIDVKTSKQVLDLRARTLTRHLHGQLDAVYNKLP